MHLPIQSPTQPIYSTQQNTANLHGGYDPHIEFRPCRRTQPTSAKKVTHTVNLYHKAKLSPCSKFKLHSRTQPVYLIGGGDSMLSAKMLPTQPTYAMQQNAANLHVGGDTCSQFRPHNYPCSHPHSQFPLKQLCVIFIQPDIFVIFPEMYLGQ